MYLVTFTNPSDKKDFVSYYLSDNNDKEVIYKSLRGVNSRYIISIEDANESFDSESSISLSALLYKYSQLKFYKYKKAIIRTPEIVTKEYVVTFNPEHIKLFISEIPGRIFFRTECPQKYLQVDEEDFFCDLSDALMLHIKKGNDCYHAAIDDDTFEIDNALGSLKRFTKEITFNETTVVKQVLI